MARSSQPVGDGTPRARSVLLALGCLGAVLALSQGTATAGQGYWRLHRVEMDKPKLVYPSYVISASAKSGAFVSRIQFRDKNTRKDIDNQIVAWSWGPMPRALVTGNPLALTYRATVTYAPKQWVGIHYSWMGAETQGWTANGWMKSGVFVNAKGQGQLNIHIADKQGTARELKTAVGVRPGRRGDQFAVAVILEHPSQTRWTWRYIYLWDEGPPPADPGEPIPPGIEWKGGPVPPGPGGTGTTVAKPGTAGGATTTPGTGSVTRPGGTGTPTVRPVVPGAGMILKADRRAVKAGGTVTVPIWLLKARDVGNLDFTVAYDPAVLRPAGKAIKGNLLDAALFESNTAESGLIRIGFAARKGINGDGTVAQIRFQAVGPPGRRAPLRLAVTTINSSTGARLQIATVDGEIQTLTADGRLPGDANGNGQLDLADALAALKMSVKLIAEDLVCDMDADRSVTSNDARILFQKVSQR